VRRSGRKGDYLLADDYTGNTIYGSQARRDFWGMETKKPLLRNLQEIATALSDPYPVNPIRGPQYEYMNPCDAEVAPLFVGTTNVPTSQSNMAFQVLNLAPGVGTMEIGCTFIVQ
jgi:hypothetical protein